MAHTQPHMAYPGCTAKHVPRKVQVAKPGASSRAKQFGERATSTRHSVPSEVQRFQRLASQQTLHANAVNTWRVNSTPSLAHTYRKQLGYSFAPKPVVLQVQYAYSAPWVA